jgi:RNA polymerase sigma factor (sigma-70 family)
MNVEGLLQVLDPCAAFTLHCNFESFVAARPVRICFTLYRPEEVVSGRSGIKLRHNRFWPTRSWGIQNRTIGPNTFASKQHRQQQQDMARQSNAVDDSSDPRWFSTTHWSVVLSAGRTESSHASDALEKLCRGYWPPLYSYIRRQGHGPTDAQDLTQAFFAKLLAKNFWARADPQKGRFRSFLLTALRHFLADERDRARTAKRGGGLSFISLDEQASEERYLQGLSQNLSGEQQFDRQWAATVMEQARTKLRQECIASGKSGLFDRVSLVDRQSESAIPHAVIAQELGTSVSAVKSAVSRLRDRYGELVRQEVAHTVSNPAEIEGEIRYLLSVIGA